MLKKKRFHTVRVVKISTDDIEKFEKFVSSLEDSKCVEVYEYDEAVSAIYEELEATGTSEAPLNFAKRMVYEIPNDSTELMKHIAENTPIDELIDVLDCCNEIPSEGVLHQIKTNISDKLKNIFKRIVE